MIDDYLAVMTRAFEEPYTADLRALVRVCGDHFEQHGDPRGTLIALGEAHYDATGKELHRLQADIDAHVLEHHAPELGALADYVKKPRTCVLEWRCGQLYGAVLDTRRIPPDEVGRAARALLYAPAAQTLRRLTIRGRRDRDIDVVLLDLRDLTGTRPPLEQLMLLHDVRPVRFGGWEASTASSMGKLFPRLVFYAERHATYSLMPLDSPLAPEKLDTLIRNIEAPLDESRRIILGRALTQPDVSIRIAALAKVEELGEHAAWFVDLLGLLLQPGVLRDATVTAPYRAIVEALRAIGPAARRARPVLAKIPGRSDHYDVETRRAAGKLVATLR